MKLDLITLIRLVYYWRVIKLMRNLKPHFVDKKSGNMIDWWSEVYKGKANTLLKHKYDNF